jgi:drug/metabolite transporter (DMT)-like permease
MTTTQTRRRRFKTPSRKTGPGTTLRPYLWMLCSCVSFTLMGAFAHGLRDRCDWPVIAFARSSVAMILAAVLVVVNRKHFVVFKPPVLWMRSFAGSVSLVCSFYALTHMPVADVFTLTNMVPIWVAVLSWPLFGRPPDGSIWI